MAGEKLAHHIAAGPCLSGRDHIVLANPRSLISDNDGHMLIFVCIAPVAGKIQRHRTEMAFGAGDRAAALRPRGPRHKIFLRTSRRFMIEQIQHRGRNASAGQGKTTVDQFSRGILGDGVDAGRATWAVFRRYAAGMSGPNALAELA